MDIEYRIMMAGNIADGLGIDSLVALLYEMNDTPEAKFIFVGGGNLQKQMEDECKRKGLNNVYFMGKQPFSKMPAFYVKADALLLTLKATTLPHLDVTVPARLQGFMAGGKPVLAMIGKGASDLINEANCGYAILAYCLVSSSEGLPIALLEGMSYGNIPIVTRIPAI